MIGLFDKMERLGFPFRKEIATDMILHFLLGGYEQFELNFYMNEIEKSLTELHDMLKTIEPNVKGKHKTEILVV